MGRNQRASHIMADLGSCMHRSLAASTHAAHEATPAPWGLVEQSGCALQIF